MEFTKEFIEEHGLQDEQINAVKSYYEKEILPNVKKEFDGLANKNAEGILDGASRYAREKLGVDVERNQGEKYADYIQRVTDAHFSSKQSEIEKRQEEIELKLKNFKGADSLKGALEEEKQKNDDLLKQIAELEPLKGLDVKYQEATEKLTNMQKEIAYNGVKPSFPDTANKFEVDAKWNAWKKSVEEKYNIQIVDGKPIAVDKENIHKQVELSELLAQNEEITQLLQGREQKGTGGKPASMVDVDGVPFKVPQDADSIEISKLVREHLIKELGDPYHPEYAKKFQELLVKVKSAKK